MTDNIFGFPIEDSDNDSPIGNINFGKGLEDNDDIPINVDKVYCTVLKGMSMPQLSAMLAYHEGKNDEHGAELVLEEVRVRHNLLYIIDKFRMVYSKS